ncbi:MAG: hypothetical protein K6A92_06290 [Lachnospiraceae bacterium]|nr:hypothetical protein [Lachnospiraceae bacterium]
MKRLVWILIALLILLAGMWSRTQVMAYNQAEDAKAYYEMQEKEARSRMRDILAEEGYSYSGITMTKQMPDEHTRRYAVSIHNQAFAFADDEEKRRIGSVLKEVCFAAAGEDRIEFTFVLED